MNPEIKQTAVEMKYQQPVKAMTSSTSKGIFKLEKVA